MFCRVINKSNSKYRKKVQKLFEDLLPLIENRLRVTVNELEAKRGKIIYRPKLWNLILPQMFILRSNYESLSLQNVFLPGNDLSEKEAEEVSNEIYRLLTKRRIRHKVLGKLKTVRYVNDSECLFPEFSYKRMMIEAIKFSLMNDRVLTLVGLWGGIKILSGKMAKVYDELDGYPFSGPDLVEKIALENLYIRFHEIEKLGIKLGIKYLNSFKIME